jgi:hypothetical protein
MKRAIINLVLVTKIIDVRKIIICNFILGTKVLELIYVYEIFTKRNKKERE